MLKICREIAEEVQKAVAPILGTEKASQVVGRGADGAPTLEIDRVAEDAARRVLQERRANVLLVSEEAGVVSIGGKPEYICVLDPIDGSYNATHGVPIFAVSVAFARYSPRATLRDVEFALVKNLATGETFEAERGKGARRGGKAISKPREVDKRKPTLSAYLGGENAELLTALLSKAKPRSLGCVALELCFVAGCGYAGLIDLRGELRNIDVAAAKLVLEEAGGVASGARGEALSTKITKVERLSIVAACSAGMHEELLNLVRVRK